MLNVEVYRPGYIVVNAYLFNVEPIALAYAPAIAP